MKNLGFKRGEFVDFFLIFNRFIYKKNLRVGDLVGYFFMGNVFCKYYFMNYIGLFFVIFWNLLGR